MVKKIQFLLIILITISIQIAVFAQEKRIKFDKGILEICSLKNFQIVGYDGDEVIIKNLNIGDKNMIITTSSSSGLNATTIGQLSSKPLTLSSKTDKDGKVIHIFNDSKRKQGLKKLGKQNEDSELGIYFTIEEKDGVLMFKDKERNANSLLMCGTEKYEVRVPNSVKLNWKTTSCDHTNSATNKNVVFFNTSPSSLTDFSGEVEISSKLNNMKLTDVTGPVSINTLGGNITIVFKNKKPEKLYSIYSNNGFIDVQIPEKSNLILSTIGKAIYSDIDFTLLKESEENDFGQTKTKMILKLGAGKVKMKLDAGYGNVYLRK
jgi:hypothetical protein